MCHYMGRQIRCLNVCACVRLSGWTMQTAEIESHSLNFGVLKFSAPHLGHWFALQVAHLFQQASLQLTPWGILWHTMSSTLQHLGTLDMEGPVSIVSCALTWCVRGQGPSSCLWEFWDLAQQISEKEKERENNTEPTHSLHETAFW
jgi:hypothetical protein